MKAPFQKDEALLADIERIRSGDPAAANVWWLGQSGFLVASAGKTILFDPYLSDSLTRKYAETDKPHIRMTGQVVDPGALRAIDVITSSHNHTDHLDRDTLLPLFAANPDTTFVIPEANRAFVAERLGTDPDWPIGLDDGAMVEVDGLTFRGIAAAHDDLKTDEAGRHAFLGFVVQLGDWTLYHSGDTRLYPGLAERLTPLGIDLAFLPINGYRPERRVAGNLDGEEAAALADACDLGHVVPHHFDLFTFNTADPETFIRACASRGVDHTVLRNGQRLTLHP
ncbi:MAG: MBL fold metallo-hydrolase [Opitutales bacterium]